MRPPLPVDETRYLAVAWDMWLEGHYLVPHLNGAPYSHKPPLLFWLMTGGWHVFGLNEWWPRLVAPLFGLGCLALTARLARALWPERREVADLAPLLLFGSVFWTLFTTLTMFDMLLAFFALMALLGLLHAARTGGWSGFMVAGVALGLGGLAKGPAILLHVLPVALSAPWWVPRLAGPVPSPSWVRWYGGVLLSVALGVAIGLAWAVPAGIAGGEAYRNAIFWGQSAGRVVNAFAHARPFWWYVAVFPALVLPWLLWPPVWRAFRRLTGGLADGGLRLGLVWFATAFLVFSLISGKQLHYLLPEFPSLALIAARLLADTPAGEDMRRPWLAAFVFLILGLALLGLPMLPIEGAAAGLASDVAHGWAGLLLAAAAAIAFVPLATVRAQAVGLSGLAAVSVLTAYLSLYPVLENRYDPTPLAAQLKAFEDEGRAIADFGKYHGQYHFPGRLTKPIAVIGLDRREEEKFLARHPDGVVVAYYRNPPKGHTPLHAFHFRKMTAVIWPARALIETPRLGDRR
ncbi:MAG: glycosyltransferase family 39 protein [Magnetovibrio sp.]|nr:glycosyltransferase family 39 protein [Magnetovibrio sp.]